MGTLLKCYFEYGETEMGHLCRRDKKLAAVIKREGVIRREVKPDPFSALVESVVSQQISSKAALTVCGRLADLCGGNYRKLHTLKPEKIQSCGMSMRKAGYIKGIAGAAASGSVDFDRLHEKSDTEIVQTLTALNGVGRWTAEMLLIFSLQRPDVVSYGDLGIRRGMMRLYALEELGKEQFAEYAKKYSPYGSVASLYLWKISAPDYG